MYNAEYFKFTNNYQLYETLVQTLDRYIFLLVPYILLRLGPYLSEDTSPTAESLRLPIRRREKRSCCSCFCGSRAPGTGCVHSECAETLRPRERRD